MLGLTVILLVYLIFGRWVHRLKIRKPEWGEGKFSDSVGTFNSYKYSVDMPVDLL